MSAVATNPPIAGPAPKTADRESARLGFRLTLPAQILVLFISVFPLLMQLYISLTDWSPLDGVPWWSAWESWNTFANYTDLAVDDRFWSALGRTAMIMLVCVPAEFLLGFALALLFMDDFRGKRFFYSILLMPMMVVPAVAGYMFFMLFQSGGPVNDILSTLSGTTVSLAWLSSPQWALVAVMLADIWQWTPLMFLILLAGLAGVPEDQLRAATLLGANLPVDRALRLSCQQARPRMRPFVQALYDGVVAGRALSEAMRAHPGVFPVAAIEMVKAGEMTGTLAGIFARLAETSRRQEELRSAITSALIYPALLIGLSFIIIIVVVSSLLPSIAPLFDAPGVVAPMPIRLMKAAERLMAEDWPFLLAAGFATALGAFLWWRNPKAQVWRNRMLRRGWRAADGYRCRADVPRSLSPCCGARSVAARSCRRRRAAGGPAFSHGASGRTTPHSGGCPTGGCARTAAAFRAADDRHDPHGRGGQPARRHAAAARRPGGGECPHQERPPADPADAGHHLRHGPRHWRSDHDDHDVDPVDQRSCRRPMTWPGDKRVADGQDGFTLVELLVVLALIAVISGVSALRIGATQDSRRATEAAGLVASTLRQLRLVAIQTGTPVAMPLAASQQGLVLKEPVELRIGPDVTILAKSGRQGRAARPEEPATIVFLPDGRSSGGNLRIKVGEVVRTIRVNWLTGLVSEETHAAR